MTTVYKNQVLPIEGTVTDSTGTAIDISTASVKSMVLVSPLGVATTKTATFTTTGVDGKIRATTANTDLSITGEWQVYWLVTIADVVIPTEPEQFTVLAIGSPALHQPSIYHMATVNDVKKILGLTDDTKDEYIAYMIPVVQDYILRYTQNDFTVNQSYSGPNIAFVNGGASADTITDADSYFVYYGLHAGPVYVSGSLHNDGHHIVTTAAAGTLTLYSVGNVTSENPNGDQFQTGYSVTISQVKWPEGLKFALAQLLKMHMDNPNGVNSETIGDYSYSMPTSYTENPIMAAKLLRSWTKIRGY